MNSVAPYADFGPQFIRSLSNFGLLTPNGPHPDAYKNYVRYAARPLFIETCRSSLMNAHSPPIEPTNSWIIGAEQPTTFIDTNSSRLENMNRAIKYSILTDHKPCVIVPPMELTTHTSSRDIIEFNIENDEESGSLYINKVLSWIHEIRDLIIDGHILMAPSVAWYEFRRSDRKASILNHDDLEFLFDVPMQSIGISRPMMEYLSENITQNMLDSSPVRPWPNNSDVVKQYLRIMLEGMPYEGLDPTYRHEYFDRFVDPAGSAGYAMYTIADWVIWLGVETSRTISEYIMYKSSPILNGSIESGLLNLIFKGDSNYENPMIDISTINIPDIDSISIEDAAELSVRYRNSCQRLGFAIDSAMDEVKSAGSEVEKSRKARSVQRNIISDPLKEVETNISSNNRNILRQSIFGVGNVALGGGGLALSLFGGSPSIELVSSLFTALWTGYTSRNVLEYMKAREALEGLPSYVVYQVGRRARRRRGRGTGQTTTL